MDKPTIGTFTLIKNEAVWIGPHLASFLPLVDQMVFFDGFSNDGTFEIIEMFRKSHPLGHKIKLYAGQDPANLQAAYVEMFDACLKTLDTDLAWFVHPDMVILEPGDVSRLAGCIAGSSRMKSYAGEPGGQLYEVVQGRALQWKNIYRLRNPDLGAHYHGHYGAADEDVYFREITGDAHVFRGADFGGYPYPVVDSGFVLAHFSDVRPLDRRVQRMERCLLNQGHPADSVQAVAAAHPRVALKEGGGFRFDPASYPAIFSNWELQLEASIA